MRDHIAALERLGKWRVLFTGWQLGTRPKGDPESDAVRDHREATIMLRAEVSALTACLIETDVIPLEMFHRQLEIEADALSRLYERRFPGVCASDDGLVFDPVLAAETMRGWLP